jgi:hypothetical protein
MKRVTTTLRRLPAARRVSIVVASACLFGALSGGTANATALSHRDTTYVHVFEDTSVAAIGPLGSGYSYRTASGERWAATLTRTSLAGTDTYTRFEGRFVEVSTSAPSTECRGFYSFYRSHYGLGVVILMRIDSMTGPGPCAAPIGNNVSRYLQEALPSTKTDGYDVPAANGIWGPPVGGSSGPRRAWPAWIAQRPLELSCASAVRRVWVGAVLSPIRFRENPKGSGFAIGVLADGCEFEASLLNVAPASMPF